MDSEICVIMVSLQEQFQWSNGGESVIQEKILGKELDVKDK